MVHHLAVEDTNQPVVVVELAVVHNLVAHIHHTVVLVLPYCQHMLLVALADHNRAV
jgi:hypothetical protein